MLRVLWFLPVAISLNGCTLVALKELGRHDLGIKDLTQVAEIRDDVVLKFEAVERKSRQIQKRYALQSRIRKDVLFASPKNGVVEWNLKEVPLDANFRGEETSRCIEAEHKPGTVFLTDTCTFRKTELDLRGRFYINDPWRPAKLAIVLPLAVAADIAMSPIYLILKVACKLSDCHPLG